MIDTRRPQAPRPSQPPRWLSLFCYALMGPACAINGALIAIAIPALAPYGFPAIYAAAAVGAVIGLWPARWMARKIHDGLSDSA